MAKFRNEVENISPDLLQDIAKCYSISSEDLLKNIENMKNNEIIQQHPYDIFPCAGRYYTYLPDETKPNGRRQVAKSTREAVQKEIIAYYKKRRDENDIRNLNLENLYEQWMLWRRDTGTDPNTQKKNISDWNRFVKNNPIAKSKIVDISMLELEDFFFHITKNHAITFKQLSNVRSVISGIFKYAVRIGVIGHSIVFDVDYRQFRTRCRPETSKKEAYTDDERRAILQHLENKTDVYSLAISFAFRLMLRVGELEVLHKSDVKSQTLKVGRSSRRSQKLNDDFTYGKVAYDIDDRIKGNSSVGIREVTLSPKAQQTAAKAMELYPNGKYLFMKNDKPILGRTLNNNLKRVCETLNIPYRSSHQIRYTTATNLSEAGVPINQLSYELGHCDIRTSQNYVHQRKMDERSRSIIAQVQDL